MCDRLDPDDDGLINQQGCGQLYLKLEECLGEHERDWRRCQAEARPRPPTVPSPILPAHPATHGQVKAFRGCYAAWQASTQPGTAAKSTPPSPAPAK